MIPASYKESPKKVAVHGSKQAWLLLVIARERQRPRQTHTGGIATTTVG